MNQLSVLKEDNLYLEIAASLLLERPSRETVVEALRAIRGGDAFGTFRPDVPIEPRIEFVLSYLKKGLAAGVLRESREILSRHRK